MLPSILTVFCLFSYFADIMKRDWYKGVNMTGKSLTTSEPLSFREALGILTDINVSYDEWGDLPFITLIKPPAGKKNFPDLETIVEMVNQRSVKILADNIKRNDRRDRTARRVGNLKKGSWSTIQRKGLLVGKVQYRLDNLSTRHYFDQALASIRDCGWSMPCGARGPVPVFDRQKVAAAVLTKFLLYRTWVALRRALVDACIDLRTDHGKEKGANPVPSVPILHGTFASIPGEVLEDICCQLSQRCSAIWEEITGAPAPLEYVVDGSTHPTPFHTLCNYGEIVTWKRVSLLFNLITRNIPHTVEGLLIPGERGLSEKDIRPMLQNIPARSTVLGDSAYDINYLYKFASKSNITLMANPREYFGKPASSWFRKRVHAKFDRQLYRRRKLGERIFGILEKRGILAIKRKTVKTIWQGLRWALVAHNLLALIKLTIKEDIFKTINLVPNQIMS
jgi:hypothetical protein